MNLRDAPTADSGSQTALDLLRAQHAELARLFDQYLDGTDDLRDRVIVELSRRLRFYSYLEEEILYPVVRHEAEDTVRRSVKAHAAFRACLEELGALSPYDPEHHAMVARLIEAVEEHIREEEALLIPRAEARLKDAASPEG
jgi:hypothetical protein